MAHFLELRQRGEMLLEHAGQADDRRLLRRHTVGAPVDERRGAVARAQDRTNLGGGRRRGGVAAQPRRRLQQDVGEVALVLRGVASIAPVFTIYERTLRALRG